MSEHIRNLEAHLDCSLFDRMGRSIIPTKEANILYPKAVAILEDLAKLEGEIALAGKTVAGELIIGASTIPGAYILPQLASAFKKQYPGISFEIRINDSAGTVGEIQANNLYFGIVGAKIPARQNVYHRFAEEELVLASSPDNPLPETIEPEQLKELPFIFRENGSGTRNNTEAYLAGQKLELDQLNIVAVLGSSTAVKEAVKANLGVSFISRYALEDEIDSGMIRTVRVRGLSMERSLYIAAAKKRTLPHHYQVFLDYLRAQGTTGPKAL